MAQSSPSSAAVPPYEYKALPEGPFIRMLTVYPGETSDPLKGKLDLFNINSSEKYEPLSYVWGNSDRTHDIICDGGRLGLTTSLDFALRRLRLPDQPRRLWADQICINQEDIQERSEQVQFMNSIYKNASHVLVWLGSDPQSMAEQAFKFIHDLAEIFHDKQKSEEFHINHTDLLHERTGEAWIPLEHVTNLPWFTRAWIVQEIGTRAPATLFWGDAEIDWKVLHTVCEKLTDYHHLRKHFDIKTDLIKYVFQRFIEPEKTSRHANRFSLMYELHRARHLKITDPRDRVFAMLGHYSVRMDDNPEGLAGLHADYNKTLAEVYIDVAVRALKSDTSSLITLAAVQHLDLPSGSEVSAQPVPGGHADKKTLPSWVPNWETYTSKILSEPISPHRAHGKTNTKLQIRDRVLKIFGVNFDTVEACSETLKPREFHLDSSNRTLAIQTLWHDICGKGRFDLEENYITGHSAFFAYTQTLSNGSVSTSSWDTRDYHEIQGEEWLAQAAAYLTKAIGQSDDVAPVLYEKAVGGDHYKWSRAANGASSQRKFAKTSKGYFVLGPKVMAVGDIVCVLFGGKLPFCLRPCGSHYLLVGECYVHGLMHGEAMEMLERNELAEEEFYIV